MKAKNLFKYFFEEIFNLTFIIITIILELSYFILLLANKLDPVEGLKYSILINIIYFFFNLLGNKINKQCLYFLNNRLNLYLALSSIYFIFIFLLSLNYTVIAFFFLRLNNIFLDLFEFFDVFIYTLSIFLVFLSLYTLLKDKTIIFILPLSLAAFLLMGILKDYNYLFLSLEFNNILYINNESYFILLNIAINYFLYTSIYFIRVEK